MKAQLQPAAVRVPLHVKLRVPPRLLTLQLLSQVMVQVPAEQVTLAPAPTVWVQLVPAQSILQLAPHVPVQVALGEHAKLQPVVELLHASKAHC